MAGSGFVSRGLLHGLLLFIAAATLVSGVVQLCNPAFVLRIVSAEQTATTRHFFAIVGMFMALFGGLLLQTLLAAIPAPAVLLWSGLQKAGASAAVGLGVVNHILSAAALAIAAFDLFSGIVIFVYLWKPSNAR
jgi:hypothetical protein